jgi:hypothetical protein
MAQKWGLQLKAVRPTVLFPILAAASLEDDAELHQQWAALLADAASVLATKFGRFPKCCAS